MTKDGEYNWIGYAWQIQFNGGKGNMPSLNQIEWGLVALAME